MTWKLFFQIVLLIIIGAIVASATKISIYKCGLKSMRSSGMHDTMSK